MKEHILLVNYDFPPNPGIGGRRWGKLAKGLANEGYVVHVIKADAVKGNNASIWSEDVRHENIHVLSLPRAYPAVISHTGSSLLDKLRYRFEIFRLKRKVKGTIYDLSAEWESYLTQACEELCTSFPIRRIIATGAPWHMLYTLAKWNTKNRRLQYIVDFRDPWLHARNYGMAQLDEKRKSYEAYKQAYVLESAHVILSPDPVILEALKEFAEDRNLQTGKMFALRHFFDPDDFKNIIVEPKSLSVDRKFTIVYGGDLYQDMLPELESIAEFFRRDDNHLHVELEIYTDARVPSVVQSVKGITIHHSAGKNFYSIAARADALLILLPTHKKHEFTTKFYDYMPLKKPYIVASQGGPVAEFVVEQGLGYVWVDKGSYPWFDAFQNESFTFNRNYNADAFSLKATTQQLIALFQ